MYYLIHTKINNETALKLTNQVFGDRQVPNARRRRERKMRVPRVQNEQSVFTGALRSCC